MECSFDRKYLEEEKIKGFDSYKYSCIDNSPLSVYISHPFWNQVVKLYPLWLAPNVLTLAGFLMVMGGLLLMTIFDYDLNAATTNPVPNWIWLACAICTFMGHTLDGTDGKQARRTGTSGPTGEMFDHGLDSWATLPFTLTLFSAFGRLDYSISAVRMLGVLMSVQLVFIVTHWEKYNTGVLFLSWGYDASQFGLTLFYMITYVCGTQWVAFNVAPGFAFANLLEVVFYASCAASVAMSLYNIHDAYMVSKTGKQPSFVEGIRPLTPFVVLCALSLVWGVYSQTGVIDLDPRAFIMFNGTIFANIACRLIISQMTATKAEVTNTMLYPLAGATLIFCLVPCGRLELWVLWIMTLAVTVAHIHYVMCIVKQMCEHFNINALTIRVAEDGGATTSVSHTSTAISNRKDDYATTSTTRDSEASASLLTNTDDMEEEYATPRHTPIVHL